MPTADCSSSGGRHHSGFCDGPSDIQVSTGFSNLYSRALTGRQCCVKDASPSPTGGSCKHNDGTAGTCISTDACAAKGGKSEAGHCPGGSDIQVLYMHRVNLPPLERGHKMDYREFERCWSTAEAFRRRLLHTFKHF